MLQIHGRNLYCAKRRQIQIKKFAIRMQKAEQNFFITENKQKFFGK